MKTVHLSATDRITYVWIITSALTILAWGLATALTGHRVTASTPEAIAVLAIGEVKAWLIIEEFMEVRSAPRWLRRFTSVWLFGLGATVLAMYLY
jgi:hypothetical protein